MSTLVRFAPSPTGRLHIGNLRTAVINFLFAKKTGGEMMLRLDDTDAERSREEFAVAIQQDLKWLGIEWQQFARQSDRFDRYMWAFEKLKNEGRLYPCYETQEELSIKRKLQLSKGKPPLYDRAALQLTDAQKKKIESDGIKPHWRFQIEHKDIIWEDLARGTVKFEGENLSDPVLFRAEDLRPIYSLASVVDDGDLKITHVMRGEDHISNTALQIQIAQALGFASPVYSHTPLMVDKEGGKLSKRMNAMGVDEMRETGIEPMAILSMMARLGTSDAVEPFNDLNELVQAFDITKFGRNKPKFSVEELHQLNAKLIHHMSFDQVSQRLAAMGVKEIDQDFWETVRPNLNNLKELKDWWDVCRGDIDPVIEDKEFITQAAELLPPAPWNQETWMLWANKVKEKTGKKGKELFMPLRMALTGQQHGPELNTLLPLIGPEKARERLTGKAA